MKTGIEDPEGKVWIPASTGMTKPYGKEMRITLNIDAEILEEVVKATGAPSKKKAIEIAIKEFLRAKCREELSKLIGNYEEFGLSPEELETMRVDP